MFVLRGSDATKRYQCGILPLKSYWEGQVPSPVESKRISKQLRIDSGFLVLGAASPQKVSGGSPTLLVLPYWCLIRSLSHHRYEGRMIP